MHDTYLRATGDDLTLDELLRDQDLAARVREALGWDLGIEREALSLDVDEEERRNTTFRCPACGCEVLEFELECAKCRRKFSDQDLEEMLRFE